MRAHLYVFPPIPGDGNKQKKKNSDVELGKCRLDDISLTLTAIVGEDEPGEEEDEE